MTRFRKLFLLVVVLIAAISLQPVKQTKVDASCLLCSIDLVCPGHPDVPCGDPGGGGTCYCNPYGGPTSYRCRVGEK